MRSRPFQGERGVTVLKMVKIHSTQGHSVPVAPPAVVSPLRNQSAVAGGFRADFERLLAIPVISQARAEALVPHLFSFFPIEEM